MLGLIKKTIGKKSRLSKINKEFTDQIGKIARQIAKGKRNEEETRRWCVDLMRTALGYKDADLETEASALGQRIDIAVKHNDRIIMVVECKAATIVLTKKAVMQAANYASSVGADWVCVTNGHNWMLFRVRTVAGAEPDIMMLFHVDILDEDGLSKDDAQMMYLLTKDALLGGDTEQEYHNQNCFSGEFLIRAIADPSIVKQITDRIKAEYKKEMGVSVSITDEAVADFMRVFLSDLSEEE